MSTPTLRSVQAKLKETMAGLLNIWTFVKNIKETDVLTVSHIKVRLDDLDGLWEKYNSTVIEIKSHEEYPEETTDRYATERLTASNYYYEGKALLMEKLRDHEYLNNPEQSTRSESLMNSTVEHVRLPQLKLQTFNGDYDKWLGFRDLYLSLIHWKTDLPDIEKFHYLKGCLEGKPRTMIDTLEVTAANYPLAWDALLKEYNDNKQLLKRQVQALFELPSLARESASDLQQLFERFERAVQTLDHVSQPADYKDLLLIQLLTTRFDTTTRRAWEEYSSTKEKDTLGDLTEFLQRRIRMLEAIPPKAVDTRNVQQSSSKHKVQMVKGSYNNVQTSDGRCVACSKVHYLHTCSKFQGMTVSDRVDLLNEHKLCRNCLRPNHQAAKCRSRFNCRNCNGRHHTLVCFKSDNNTRETVTTNEATLSEAEITTPLRTPSSVNKDVVQTTSSHPAQHTTSKALLATAIVLLEGAGGTTVQARALLDSGSEGNFITENMCQLLRAHRSKTVVTVQGIGRSSSTVKHKVQATVRSRVTDYSKSMSFLVLPKVTVDLPISTINIQGWSLPSGIQLADPAFFESSKVDVVLGIESFFDFFKPEHKIPLGDKLPTLISTVFGWVVCGSMEIPEASTKISCNCTVSLEELLSRFWACEEIGTGNNYSKEERYCEAQFKSTVRRAVDGRYVVSLPKNEGVMTRLGESREIAIRRLLATERRLARDENLRKQYHSFMEEYIQLGHMRKVNNTSVRRCYLPHHPVVKESSTTTKVRVVFDASCKTSTGISLNDALFAGPIVQEDLRAIILRCRIRQIMIVSDAEKMFRQIVVNSDDCPLQSIVWRFSTSDPIDTYELSTVTYGTKSAPFLATRVLKQLADDEGKRFPLAAKTVNEDVYMDDVITGADTVESAIKLRSELDQMLTSGGFNLRKWASNSSAVLEGIPAENLAIQERDGIDLDPDPSVSTLGLTWKPRTDQFKFKFHVPPLDNSNQWTKRKILSVIASLFDPLGHLGATIVRAKIFMQRLWCLRNGDDQKLDWDELVPPEFAKEWEAYYKELSLLQDIHIPRCVMLPDSEINELHCFSDASSEAYGCCIYLRSCNAAGQVSVNLLTSKSKVAPLKTQSIPRLELCAAYLAVELYTKVKKALKIPVSCYFWTDSSCVLRWLQLVPNKLKTFVANRVSKIQILSDGCGWRHVPGAVNPADMISRGISPAEIALSSVWWKGPDWLINLNDWPAEFNEPVLDAEVIDLLNNAAANIASPLTEFNVEFISKYPTYNDLIRRTAYWLRLMDLLKKPKDNRMDGTFLSIAELNRAENTIIRRVQQETFPNEWQALLTGQPLPIKSPLRWYNPFICKQDYVLKVGGRLAHSREAESTKHPVVLPARHILTKKLMLHYHEKLLHAGSQLMLATLRLRYWPLGGRSIARQVVHKCVVCSRCKPTAVQQFMGELPAARVTVSRPFSKTGVDYFGPVYVRPGPRRVAVKAYVALFVCMCTKAVHMELVTDLSTEQFLQSLRRFISRRGCPTDIFSDNGTNFVGARNLMKSFLALLKDRDHRDMVAKECSQNGIQWHFTPPAGPHFGGLWEAAVKSAKQHILKVIGETALSFEDMNTLIIQVEGCLNSRPLTQITDDPNDLEPLTPAHFLAGSSLQSLPEPDFSKEPFNRLKRWQVVQRHLQHFWSRWRKEYLSQLQGRVKRWKPPVKIDVGQLVVIQDDRQPPLRWKMGRIHQLHPGDDNVVRVVTLKTASGFLDRPVEKICILPVADTSEVL